MSKSKQQLLDERYLRMARIWAENSYCERRQVGALIVRGDAIISDGYNGTPSGFENICRVAGERSSQPDDEGILHGAGVIEHHILDP